MVNVLKRKVRVLWEYIRGGNFSLGLGAGQSGKVSLKMEHLLRPAE